MEKETWLIVSKETKALSYGVIIDGELWYFDIGIADNVHNWGITVIDPDGHTDFKCGKHEKDISVDVECGNAKLKILALRKNNYYEFCITEY